MEGFRKVFSEWELRIYITLSLVLQILPILWTYYRRRISSHPFRRVLWLTAFLAADFIATLSLGAIFHLSINPKSTQDTPKNKYLLALWAPFILLHLGKHSRITTFTLADNEFWLGHFVRFIYHELMALYICYLASTENRVKSISIILFLTGTIKFGERIIAMKRGSMNELRISTYKKADHGFTSLDLEKHDRRNKTANNKGDLEADALPDDKHEDHQQPLVASCNADVIFLCAAYQSFNKYKGLYIDPLIAYGDQEDGQSFQDIETVDALKLIEMELGFAYDLFYTKTACFHPIWSWIVRFTSLSLIFSALVLFSHIDKREFFKPDIHITYMLLVAALILEMESFLESMVSDQAKVQIGLWKGRKWRRVEDFIQKICARMENVRGKFLQRPTGLMGQFNMLSFCFANCNSWSFVRWVLNTFELQELWKNYFYTNYFQFDNQEFKNCIFQGVQRRLREEKNVLISDTPVITLTLLNHEPRYKVLLAKVPSDQFEQRLLVLHVATDLCYRMAGDQPPNSLLEAKCLSEYMMYLLAIRPSMLSSITTAELKSYRNAYATCVKFYSDFKIYEDGVKVFEKLENKLESFRRIPLEHRTQRNTLLWDAFEIACELRRLGNENINVWDVLFDVWVDMLSYVAIKTHGKVNAEVLGFGGEFITYIWLYMVHWSLNSRHKF